MNRVRVIIIDDEPLARRRIRTLLSERNEIDIVAECTDGLEAVAAIRQRKPDLVFLDIQMPELTGFEVVAAIGVARMPAVVFVTAYDQFAIKAFDVNAVDYLLKPFDRERFDTALSRALTAISTRHATNPRLAQLVQTLKDDARIPDRLLVRSSGCLTAIKTGDIQWIEAAGNYVSIHAGDKPLLHRATLKNLAHRLDSRRFIRVHRSAIVNIRYVKEIRARQSGDSDIVLDSGQTVPLSRRFRKALDRALTRRS